MKFKLDHNIPKRAKSYIKNQYGYDVETALDENLEEAIDPDLLKATKIEERILITLDQGFLDFPLYKKSDYFGLIILQLKQVDRYRTINALDKIFSNLGVDELQGYRIRFIETDIHSESYLIYRHDY